MELDTNPFKEFLTLAIKEHRNKQVMKMLETEYPSSCLNFIKTDLLHYSAKHDNAVVITYLCGKGCDPDAQDRKGETALMMALKGRHLKAIEALFDAGANPLTLNHENKSALQMVCSDHALDFGSRFMFLHKFRQKCFSSEEAAQKLIDAGCHLYQAVYTGDAKILEYMLERGYSANSTINENKTTALHEAASLIDLDSAKVLLKHGADVNALNDKGGNPLSNVLFENEKHNADKVEMLRLLLSHGASPTTCYIDGYFQSVNVLMTGDARAVGVLLSYYDFAAKDDSRGNNLLHYLCLNVNPGVTDELKIHIHKCDVNALSSLTLSPLQLAAGVGNPQMVEFLLDHGADIDHSDSNGHTALIRAYTNRQLTVEKQRQCVELLLQRGADPQKSLLLTDNERITIFDLALMNYRRTGYVRLGPVIAKLAMMEELGTKITEVIREKISSHPKLQIYYDRCRGVLRKEIHENVTPLKLLSCSERILAKYAGNKDLLVKLERISGKRRVRSSFSYYRNTLKKRFVRGIELKRLKDAAAGPICRIFGHRVDKTHIVVSRVTDYLIDEDLLQLYQLSLIDDLIIIYKKIMSTNLRKMLKT